MSIMPNLTIRNFWLKGPIDALTVLHVIGLIKSLLAKWPLLSVKVINIKIYTNIGQDLGIWAPISNNK